MNFDKKCTEIPIDCSSENSLIHLLRRPVRWKKSLIFLSKNLHFISMLSRCYIWEWIKMSFVIFLFLSPHVFSPQHWVCASSRRCYWVTVEQRGEPLHLYKKTLLMRGNGKKEAVSEWENMARVLMREKGRERWRENQEMGCRESKPNRGMSR